MKVVLIVLCVMTPCVVRATDMCARDDTMVMVFDKNVSPNSCSANSVHALWFCNYSFGVVSGESTCVSDVELENGNFTPGLYGQDEFGNNRTNCRCRMTHPLKSGWVESDSSDAKRDCTTYCFDRCKPNFVPLSRYLNAI